MNKHKKLRGKKRIFRNIWKSVNTFKIEIDNNSWIDFYHCHLDMAGIGNRSWKIRHEIIRAHLELYNSLIAQLDEFGKPFQWGVY